MRTPVSLLNLSYPLLPALFGLLLLPACGNGGDRPSNEAEAQAGYRAAVQRLQQPAEVIALGKVIPRGEILELTFEAAGKVQRILVAEGEQAAPGDLLIALDTRLEENELANLEAQLALNRLEQDEARAQVAYYERVLDQQQQTYARLQRSVEADALPASRLDQTELEMLDSRHQIGQQKRQGERLALEERRLRLRREEVQLRIAQKEIRSVGAGSVIRWMVRAGSSVQAYEEVGELAPAGPRLVEAEVDEYFAGNVHPGQPAVIRREGFPDTLARGKVIFAAPNLSDKSILSEDNTQFEDRQVRRIKISLEEEHDQLLLGRKVEAVINTSQNR